MSEEAHFIYVFLSISGHLAIVMFYDSQFPST